jgi:type II secretory pathway pseudopilin PulG
MRRLFSRTLLASSSGASLIEALIAMTLVVVTTAGVAQLLVWARRSIAGTSATTMAVMLAAEKMERLRSLTWEVDAAGLPVSDETSDLSWEPARSSGSGLHSSPSGALTSNTAGFVDFIDHEGRWRGTGARPPAGSSFIRRWSIEAWALDPVNTVVLRVVVLPVAAAAEGDRGTRGVRLTSIRTRVGRVGRVG